MTIIVAGADPDRLRSALGMAAVQAAAGGAARLFVDVPAVALIARAGTEAALPGDADRVAAGLPTAAEMIATCLDLGVAVTVCQSGLALAGITAEALDPRFGYGGLTAILAALGDDRLVVI